MFLHVWSCRLPSRLHSDLSFFFILFYFFLDKQWIVILSCEIPLLWVWFHAVLRPSTGNAILLWLQATKASNVVTIVFSPTSTHIALSLNLILSCFILVSLASVLLQNWRKTLVFCIFFLTWLLIPEALVQDFSHLTDTVSAGTEGKDRIFSWGKNWLVLHQAAEDGGGRWNSGLSLCVII